MTTRRLRAEHAMERVAAQRPVGPSRRVVPPAGRPETVEWELSDAAPVTTARRRRGVRRRAGTVGLVLVVAAALAGVVVLDRPAPSASHLGGPAAVGRPDPLVTLGSSPPFRASLLDGPPTELATGDDADRALLAAIRSGDDFQAGEGHRWTGDGWYRVAGTATRADWVHAQRPGVWDGWVGFSRRDGRWQWSGSAFGGGSSELARVLPTPSVPIDSARVDGATLTVSVTLGVCRDVVTGVDVRESPESVTLVVHDTGNRPGRCFAAAALARTTVHLAAPLGDRQLLDGTSFPDRPVPVGQGAAGPLATGRPRRGAGP